jgi:hypothetical protein
MPEQIYIGNFPKGQLTDRLPFNIDNSSFPDLFNAYCWRGRIKRKRGTRLLGQMQIQEVISGTPTPWQLLGFSLVAGAGNLISTYGFGVTATIVPGTVTLIVNTDQTYTDFGSGFLTGSSGGIGTINYSTGAFTTSAGGNNTVTGSFSYFPGNVSEGQRDFVNQSESLFPLMVSFDTTNAYQVNQTSTPFFYNVTFYKTSQNPFKWSGQDYQQFWTTNYSSALWATNGKPGFNMLALQNQQAGSKSVLQASATQVTITVVTGSVLTVNDLIWFNEVSGTIGSSATANANINGQTGIVASITVNTPLGYDTITVNFTGASGTNTSNFAGATVGTGGIIQLLTNTIAGQDGIKWYEIGRAHV